jgi:hypothetical protein
MHTQILTAGTVWWLANQNRWKPWTVRPQWSTLTARYIYMDVHVCKCTHINIHECVYEHTCAQELVPKMANKLNHHFLQMRDSGHTRTSVLAIVPAGTISLLWQWHQNMAPRWQIATVTSCYHIWKSKNHPCRSALSCEYVLFNLSSGLNFP